MEDNAEGGAGRRPKFPGGLPKNVGPRERAPRDDELETTGRMLAAREEELLSRARPGVERAERLRRDLEALKLRALTAVWRSFTCDDPDDHLSGAVAAVRLQEELDRRWANGGGTPPPWRPLKCLAAHNALLADVAESRLEEAARDGERDRALRLSTPVKRRVCGMGKRVRADLLRCARVLQPCYGPHLDVLNIYAAFCARALAARLSDVIRGGLEADDCAYLLFWVNTFYPQEILRHAELRDKLKTACLGALLRRDQLRRLEERYASSVQERVSLWLLRALRREEEKWSGAGMPEVLDDYYFCPLAIDVIQVIDGSLADLLGAGSHEVAAAHLERFLLRYQKALGKLSRRKDERAAAWMKAHLACEEQLREYVGGQAGSRLAATQRGRSSCEAILGALRDSAFSTLTRPIHEQLKVHYRRLWTASWWDGSPAVTDSLLDSLFELFDLGLAGLKASCRQSLVRAFQRELVSEYVRRMSKGRPKSAEERAGAAGRLAEDADKMDDFFHAAAGGCGDGSRSAPMLRHLANAVRLRRPEAVRQEIVAFAGKFPDFSEAALSALLALKSDISAADVSSIKRGVQEELASANRRRAPLAWLQRNKSAPPAADAT